MSSWLSLQPGSAAWLLQHECRLFFYELGDDKAGKQSQRGMSKSSKLLIVLVFAAIHAIAWKILSQWSPTGGELSPVVTMGAGLMLIVLFSLMLSMALSRSVAALFERGDLDLLLSSPVASTSVFAVRLGGIAAGISLLYLAFLSPLAHVGVLLGQPGWLGIYPVMISLAVFAASLAMLLTLILVRLIGARRTRTIAHMLSALTGAGIFLTTQIAAHRDQSVSGQWVQNWLPYFKTGAILGPDSLIWLPAHALLGSWQAGLTMLALAAVGFWLTTRLTHHFFVSGVQQAGGISHAPAISKVAGRHSFASFRSGLTRVIVIKEWRLLLRDPQLLSQIALQLLYMLPMAFVILKNSTVLSGVAAGLCFLACSLSGSLIWVIVSAEDAPDLLSAAPITRRQVHMAKLIAALLPVALLVLPLTLWLSIKQPALGFLAMAACTAGMTGTACIHLWLSKPGSRSQFNRRGKAQLVPNLVEALNNFSWAGMVFGVMSSGYWGLTGALVGLFSIGLAWMLRIERNQQP